MFYDNLKAECDKQGLKLTTIVLECGGTKGIIGGWKNGAAPRSDIVMKLAVRLNVPTDSLLFGENYCNFLSSPEKELIAYFKALSDEDKGRVLGKAETLAELAAERAEQERAAAEKQKCIALPVFLESNTEENTIDINFYDMPSSAGTGIFLDHTHYERRKIRRTAEAERADFAIPITGDSMEPVFHSGDVVLVESCPYVREGEIGIFVLDGDAFIKKYDGNRLLSLNPQYEPIELSKYETAVCLGRVLGIAELL